MARPKLSTRIKRSATELTFFVLLLVALGGAGWWHIYSKGVQSEKDRQVQTTHELVKELHETVEEIHQLLLQRRKP